MVPFGPRFVSLELESFGPAEKIAESRCGKRDKRKKPGADALGLVR
jgi:hypothetical protein